MAIEDQVEEVSTDDFAKLLSGSSNDQAETQSDDDGDEEEAGTDQAETQSESPDDQPEGESDEELEFEQGGQKVKAKKADVIKAWQDREAMQRDYTQKTQRLAEVGRQAQEAAKLEFNFVNQYASEVAQVVQITDQVRTYEQIPWQQLAQQDPQLYATRLTELTALRQNSERAVNDLKEKRAGYGQYQQAQADQAYKEVWDHMKTVDKTFSRERLVTMIDSAATQYGFNPEELVHIQDKRLVHMWSDLHRKAAAYDEIVKKSPQTAKQLAATPGKVNRPAGKPSTRQEQLIKNLQSGREIRKDDFAAMLAMSRKK